MRNEVFQDEHVKLGNKQRGLLIHSVIAEPEIGWYFMTNMPTGMFARPFLLRACGLGSALQNTLS